MGKRNPEDFKCTQRQKTFEMQTEEVEMGTRADFYIGIREPRWIGSIYKDGVPWNIPCGILIQNNAIMYEEAVIDFLMSKKATIESMGHPWDWPWEDSRMTDFSYFFANQPGAVYAYSAKDKIMFYPLRIMQGEDLNKAKVHMMAKFPKMGVGYGPNAAKTV